MSPDGALVAGQLYPDAVDPTITWYLPTYRLNTDQGRYTTSLKWRAPTDPPDGPLAYLEVELAAVAPANATAASREIGHQAIVRLAYRLPVGSSPPPGLLSGPPQPGPGPVPLPPHQDPAFPTLQLELGVLTTAANNVRSCRLGLTDKADFDRLYQVMTDVAFGGQLRIQCLATIGRRTWRQIIPSPVTTGWLDEPNVHLATIPQGPDRLHPVPRLPAEVLSRQAILSRSAVASPPVSAVSPATIVQQPANATLRLADVSGDTAARLAHGTGKGNLSNLIATATPRGVFSAKAAVDMAAVDTATIDNVTVDNAAVDKLAVDSRPSQQVEFSHVAVDQPVSAATTALAEQWMASE